MDSVERTWKSAVADGSVLAAGRRDKSLGYREERLMKQGCKSYLLYSQVMELGPWSQDTAVGFLI